VDNVVFPTGQMMRAGPMSNLAGRAVRAAGEKSVEKVAKDFESILLNKLMDSMSKTIPESGLFDSGTTKQIQGLFWHYLAGEVANQGGIGLWKNINRQIGQASNKPKTIADNSIENNS